ncbi:MULTISPECIES: hypothetical protein [unclassified Streptomyces]|uniref:hypothetical protein n=1 Tax=unclassified Streptomyces TaxID=2593676 RepID=UPI0033A2C57C
MSIPSLLLDRLRRAGLSDAVSVTPAEGGVAALAGIATRREGPARLREGLPGDAC